MKLRIWVSRWNAFAYAWSIHASGFVSIQKDQLSVLVPWNIVDHGSIYIEEWTGLVDIDDNEIYKQDIVQPMEEDFNNDGELEWMKEEQGPMVIDTIGWNCGCCRSIYGFVFPRIQHSDWSYKVIGNIHQNPELVP